MREKKWKIGPEPTNHFQRIDIDENSELADKYDIEFVPTFVLVVDGQEKARYGYLSGYELAWLWLGEPRSRPPELMETVG